MLYYANVSPLYNVLLGLLLFTSIQQIVHKHVNT